MKFSKQPSLKYKIVPKILEFHLFIIFVKVVEFEFIKIILILFSNCFIEILFIKGVK
jgi:hypothetical protein